MHYIFEVQILVKGVNVFVENCVPLSKVKSKTKKDDVSKFIFRQRKQIFSREKKSIPK